MVNYAFYFYVLEAKLILCTLAKYQKLMFQARWVQRHIKTSIYHQYLISLKTHMN